MNDAVTNARCALHPERQAQGVCKRCGNYACAECDASGFESGTLCVTCANKSVTSRYHVVPIWRFVLLHFLTLGIYPLWWFWKSWSAVKRADGSDIWPAARAIFAGFTYFSLITDINTQLAVRGLPGELPTVLGVGALLAGVASRLPAPYSLLSLSVCFFILPALKAARSLSSEAALAEAAQWRVRHTVLTVVCVPFLLLALIGTLMPGE